MAQQSQTKIHRQLIESAERLRDAMNELEFDEPVACIYNPLDYAWDLHQQFIRRVCVTTDVLFLGMNPGPWGMAQTGVPFGEIEAVRDWMKITGEVAEVDHEHPKRPIEGLACARSEVSGRRLWGLMKDRFVEPAKFFEKHFVINYCPLVFMEESGRNRTPDKLAPSERAENEKHCDQHLQEVIQCMPWKHLVGVGAFAESCLKRVCGTLTIDAKISRILHPSPASPAANRDWSGTAQKQLIDAGVWPTTP